MSGPDLESAPAARRPTACPRCGAPIDGEQAWCLECGLAARTRLATTPRWRAPLVVAGVVGLAAIVALVVAFLVLTGDNAPLPTTAPAATAPPIDTAPPAAATAITATTTTAPPAAAVPATTVPPVAPTGTTPAAPTTTPTVTVPTATAP